MHPEAPPQGLVFHTELAFHRYWIGTCYYYITVDVLLSPPFRVPQIDNRDRYHNAGSGNAPSRVKIMFKSLRASERRVIVQAARLGIISISELENPGHIPRTYIDKHPRTVMETDGDFLLCDVASVSALRRK